MSIIVSLEKANFIPLFDKRIKVDECKCICQEIQGRAQI